MNHATVEHLTPEQRSVLLANYDREARRLRSEAAKTLFSDWFKSVRGALASTFVQQHKLAHAAE